MIHDASRFRIVDIDVVQGALQPGIAAPPSEAVENEENGEMESKNLFLPVSSPEHRVGRYLHHHHAGLYPNSPKPRSLAAALVLRAAAKRIGGWMMTFQ